MAFENRGRGVPYEPREGENLEQISERATAAGNPITWQELATFNWGTDDPDEVETLKRDKLGFRHRNGEKEMVSSPDDPRARDLVIPERFKARSLLAVDRTYQLRIRKKECPKQFLGCASFPAVTFALKSSFVRPSVVAQLVHLEGLWKRHPEAKVMIFGHADKLGDALFNKKLSERRAWAAYAFIVKDPEVWEVLYNHDDEQWGNPVIQEILEDLGYDPGERSSKLNDETRAAMRAFLGVEPDSDVVNDAGFRRHLFSAYMSGKHSIDLPEDCFVDTGYMGCGEYNPVADKEEDADTNRRVTFYFFHPERVPAFPCKFANVEPCKRQLVSLENRHKDTFGCSFYDSMACHCKQESIPLLVDFRVIIATYGSPPTGAASASEWYHLTSKDGSVDEIRYATSAVPHRGSEYKIEFKDVKTANRFTLRHYKQDACWTTFSELSFVELLDLDLGQAPALTSPDQPGRLEIDMGIDFPTDGSSHLLAPKSTQPIPDDSPLLRALRRKGRGEGAPQ
jgi:hypothetical protein